MPCCLVVVFSNGVVSTWSGLPGHIVKIESFLCFRLKSFASVLASVNLQVITFNRNKQSFSISHYCIYF